MRELLIRNAIRLLWSRRLQRLLGDALWRKVVRLLKRGARYVLRYTYSVWCRKIERSQLLQLDVGGAMRDWATYPLISVAMPVYNTPPPLLRSAIESVRKQSYPYWELCIADDASTLAETVKLLRDFEQMDTRIKVTYRTENGNISQATNSALALTTGEYVAFLDHDDMLAEHALFFVAQAIVKHPEANIIYTDEDKIDGTGRRCSPHFKPEWNPDLLFSTNYAGHLAVFRRMLLESIGGLRSGVEGSQDHDLLFRCMPYCKAETIIHIPRILYHWRMVAGSTALASSEKNYTTRAGIKALNDYFVAQGMNGVWAEAGAVENSYRVHYPVPLPEPLVTILIPTRDRIDLLTPCVEGILNRTNYRNIEVLILDNQSCDPETRAYLEKVAMQDGRVRVLAYDHPFNYSAINNYGAKRARGEILALLNNDIEVINPDWLTEMVSHALRADIGCVGAKLYYDDDTIQHAGLILGTGDVATYVHKYFPRSSSGYFGRLICVQNCSAVTGACLVVRREVYERVGGLNERDLEVAFNDVDFCLRVRELGLRNLWTPYAELYHHESKSRGAEDTPEKLARFQKEAAYMKNRWKGVLEQDRYYNPNLTLLNDKLGLRVLMRRSRVAQSHA